MLTIYSLEPAAYLNTHKLADAPLVQDINIEGQPAAVAVRLIGVHGEGHSVVLDRDDWLRVKTELTDTWTIHLTSDGPYVVTEGIEALRRAGARTRLALSRWIVNARRGELVRFVGGGRLNCRRSNLRLEMPSRATVKRLQVRPSAKRHGRRAARHLPARAA